MRTTISNSYHPCYISTVGGVERTEDRGLEIASFKGGNKA